MNSRMNGMSADMIQSLSKLEQDAKVELWEIDLRSKGGQLHRFCNQMNEQDAAVAWQGKEYTPYPIQGSGFAMTTQGASNRPTLTVSNLLGLVTGAIEQYGSLSGARVTRREVIATFLDAENFASGNNMADNTQEVVSQYVLEQVTALTTEAAVFTLSAPSDTEGAIIPARIMLADVCSWQYRGEGCGYTGRPVADRYDMPTNDSSKDECSKCLLGCQARFGLNAVLPYGGFPAADKVLR